MLSKWRAHLRELFQFALSTTGRIDLEINTKIAWVVVYVYRTSKFLLTIASTLY